MKITMRKCLALSVPFLVMAGAQSASAGFKVKVPTAGDVVTLTVPVINLTGDYIEGGVFTQSSTGFDFTGYYDAGINNLNVTPPHSTGTVQFEFDASGTFTEEDNFQLPLFGFTDLANPAKTDFTDNDPGLIVDLVSQNAGPCGMDPNCVEFTLPNTITVPATHTSSTPEPGTLVPFGLGALGLGGLVLKIRKRQSA